MSKLIELLKKGLEANPGDWNIRKGIIEQYVVARDSEGLAEMIEGAPAMCEDESVATEIAGMLSEVSDEAARSFVEKATEKFPSNPKLHGFAAKLQLAAGDMSAADDHYQAAKTFDPAYTDPDLEAVNHLMASASGRTEAEPVVEPMAEATPVVDEIQEEAQEVSEFLEDAEPAAPDFVYSPELSHTSSVSEVANLEPVHKPLPVVPVEELIAPELAYVEEVDPAVDLAFTPTQELEMTRSHLTVLAPDGHAIDADAYEDEYAPIEEEAGVDLLVAEPGWVPQAAEADRNKEKVIAIITTIGAHVLLFLLIGLIIIAAPRMLPPEIIASPGPVTNENTITKKQVVQQTPTKPPAPSASVMNAIATTSASAVSVPSVDFDAPDAPVELGSTFGTGLAFGTAGAAGGQISFMGNSGSGNRVVFAVDYSLSMSKWGGDGWKSIKDVQKAIKDGSTTKHYLMRDELYTALKKLPQGTNYQVVMFSAFGFAHDAVDMDLVRGKEIYEDKGEMLLQHLKKKKAGSIGRGADLSNYEFPRYKYLTATPENIKKSCEIVEKLPTSLGTNWEHPILMALSIKPKPDIIFFMTDGSVGDPTKALSLIKEANSKGKRTIIHTTAMMTPAAANDMSLLAAQNGGKFTIVTKGGKIQKGEDFFKGGGAKPDPKKKK